MLAVIPARGGSKGLPNKNIKLFCGKPLIAYTIEEALAAPSIDRVIVSTDSQAIAEVALHYGAEVPFLRPAHLAGDTVGQFEVVQHLFQWLHEQEQYEVETFLILQPTSPLRTVDHIEAAIREYKASQAIAMIGVTPSAHPVEWTKKINDQGYLVNYIEQSKALYRQFYDQTYMPNGMIYLYNWSDVQQQGSFNIEPVTPFIVDKAYSDDIDDLLDFQIAEFKYNLLQEAQHDK